MKTRLKILNIVISSLIISYSFLSPLSSFASFDQNSAQDYLLSHSDNPWSIMALAALGRTDTPADYLKTISGDSAINYEAPILAITSLGQDPRTFGSENLVDKLKSFYSNNQLGDEATINDDIYGLLALVSAGENIADPVVSGTKDFILSHQNTNGGWGYATDGGSDSGLTAAAILALKSSGLGAGETSIQNALNYLQTNQNSDGGFTTDSQSPWGTGSDTSSTANVVWVLNALGINPDSWTKDGMTPVGYLQANQANSGYFKSDSNTPEENGFTPVATSYAVIALSGGFLPVRTLPPAAAANPTFPFRIEGSAQTVCEGMAAGPTALDIVKNAAVLCDFTYNISSTAYGPYLNKIGNDTASGLQGWLYFINDASPSVGAANYTMQSGDKALWAFGNFDILPSRLSLSAPQADSGQSITATAEYFANNSWQPLKDADVYYGAFSAKTDGDGQAIISAPDGYYKIYAQKTGIVRSNTTALTVGQAQNTNTSVSLSANITTGQVLGNNTTTPDIIAFTVTPSSLNFGNMGLGSSTNKTLAFSNTGTAKISITAQTGGDLLFTDYLKLNNASWRSFNLDLPKGANQDTSVTLNIPANSQLTSGPKSGQIIFWANAN